MEQIDAVTGEITHGVRAGPIGAMVDELCTLREIKKSFIDKSIEIQKEYDRVEALLIRRMQDEQTPNAGGTKARVTLADRTVPVVKDWDAFHSYIHKKKFFHLLERRPSVTGCRELFTLKGPGSIPGVEPFTQPSLHLVTK